MLQKSVGRNTELRCFQRTRSVWQRRKLWLGLDQWYNGTDINLSGGRGVLLGQLLKTRAASLVIRQLLVVLLFGTTR